MAKISDYAKTTSLNDTDLFIVEKSDVGTRTVSRGDLAYQVFDSIPEMHNQIWRGKSLGSSLSSTVKTNIQNGSFSNLWVGDYWTINGILWRIVHFDYFYGLCGNLTHHAVVMPDVAIGEATKWDITNAPWGYGSCTLRKTGLNQAKNTISSAFSTSVLSYNDYLTDGPADGKTRFPDGVKKECSVEIPAYHHLYGHQSAKRGSGQTGDEEAVTSSGVGTGPFSAFVLKPSLVASNDEYWTRDSHGGANAGIIGFINGEGFPFGHWSTFEHKVRPFFLVG